VSTKHGTEQNRLALSNQQGDVRHRAIGVVKKNVAILNAAPMRRAA